ncbi:threonine/serine exporter family protein [Calidifontibacter terrae]
MTDQQFPDPGGRRPLPINPQQPRQFSARARRAIAGGRPTVPIGLRGQEGGPEDNLVRLVIDLGLRVGEAMLSTGASAADVTAAVLRLTHAYGVRSIHVDITYSSITISHHRGVQRDPITVMRIAAVMQQDFTRLEQLQRLVREAETGDLELGSAHERLDSIIDMPHPYSRAILLFASAVMGAAIAALLAGEWPLILLSAFTTTGVHLLVRQLTRANVPAFFAQAAGAALPTLAAVIINLLANNLGIDAFKEMKPSVVVASGVVALLAGLAAVGAAQDTIDGFYITAAGRTFEVLLLSGGIVAGVLGVLALAEQLGVDMQITPSLQFSSNPAVGVLCAGAITFAFAVSAYAGPRTVVIATIVSMLAWVVNSTLVDHNISAQWAAMFAALVIGALATLFGIRQRVPSLALATSAIVPLLPGLLVYRGVFELVAYKSDPTRGGSTLFGAVLVGLSIASGVTLGSLPGRLRRPETLTKRRLRRSHRVRLPR